MKASEVLQRYAEGRRDFRGENLRCLSFKGKDLSGADFSEADIRGTNFTKANLTGAKFVGAKAGLPKRWVITLLLACLVLLVISSFLTVVLGVFVAYITSPKPEEAITGWVSLILFLSFSFLSIYRGINASAIAIASAFGFASAIAFAFGFAFASTFAMALASASARASVSAFAFAFASAIPSTFASASTFAIASAITSAITIAIAFASASAFGFASASAIAIAITSAITSAITIAIAFAFLSILLYHYLGWRAIKGDPRDAWIRTIAIAFAATGGTNFRYANLTDTDFTKATLKNTDFRNAILTRTCFKDTKKLDFARPGETYLKIRQVREIVITAQGQDKNFERLNLQGIYLKEANLIGASFIEANLQEACLQDANLSDAKLVHTLLDLTDLTGANLTGAYIEGWNITTETKLNGVKCDFVFMRLPPDKRPNFITLPPEERRDLNAHRQPANWDKFFEDGDFADFIAPMRQTLNLYYNKPTDPRLIALAFQQLIDGHPDADIELVAIEKKGKNKDKLILKAQTAAQADHATLSVSYSDNLGYLQSLPPETIRALLVERESTIRLLSGLIEAKHKTPEPNIHISPSFSTHQGDTMSDKSSNFQFGNVGGDVAGIAGGDISGVAGKEMTGVAGGDISGTVAVSIGELEKSDIPEAPKLADLLKQLTTAIESDTNLSDKDKAKALKQVKALAEAGQNPKDEDKKDLADTAITMLKGIVTGLPVVATSVKACQELLPLITSLFGL